MDRSTQATQEQLATVAVVDDHGVIRVAGSTSPQQLAQALANAVYEHQEPKLRAIGAGAVNQAMKALAICSGYVAPRGITLLVRPGFETVEVEDRITKESSPVSAMTFRMVVEH